MLLIGWTTVATEAEARRLAEAWVDPGLAACVQIEGPIRSLYRWEGKLEVADEYRLMVKFTPERASAVEACLERLHPYTTPEWVVVRAEKVAEKYLSWARSNSSSAPL